MSDLYKHAQRLKAVSQDVRDDPFRLAARTEMFELLDLVLALLEVQHEKEKEHASQDQRG